MSGQAPATLEVMRHALDGVAEEMGAALRHTAHSPNIKERIDCSAAVFDAQGVMAAQAEHIPVHLGSMPASVAAAIEAVGQGDGSGGDGLAPGTQVVLNDPYAGGNHLPDVTVVTAVGTPASKAAPSRLLGYVANRAHHADVGGAAPGSMPADASDIAAEGLRVPPTVLADADRPREELLALIAANSRTPAERLGDLRAQLAANHVGARRLAELDARQADAQPAGERLNAAMREVCAYSDRRVRAAVAALPDGSWEASDVLEVGDGITLRARLTVAGDALEVDLTGSDPQVSVGVNAVRAVTVSAVWFVVRQLTDPHAPPNAGCYRAVTVRTRPGTVVAAQWPAPVAAGNVETSQRIVDVVQACFAQAAPQQAPAASQGTMNNLLIGSAGGHALPDAGPTQAFSYYETTAGGEGATPTRDGMSGLHTGMTNTRNTPAEALELAYPLRVRRAELRPRSGGDGAHRGGDGVVREIELLADAAVTLQTERRTHQPWGLAGGRPGAAGRNTRVRPDGSEEALAAKGTWTLAAGERVRLETPGGGGWGEPDRGGWGEPGEP
jgi:N-methylhydantoinase B